MSESVTRLALPDDAAHLARLHLDHLNGKINDLGLPVLLAYYERLVVSANAQVTVVLKDERVAGYVVVALDESVVSQECLLSDKWRLLLDSNKVALVRAAMGYVKSKRTEPIGPTLMYIVVDGWARGSQVAETLMQAAARYFAAQGVAAFRLRVNAGNPRGINYYQKHGFRAIGFDAPTLQLLLEKPIDLSEDS